MAGEDAPAPASAFDDARSERDTKHANRVHQSWVGSGSVPSPTTPTCNRKRLNDGIDMNKKPNKKMKKHRPKVLDDSKPNKVPIPKTPKPATPNPVQGRNNTFRSCMESSTGKPKKVPMAQSPRPSTPTPKTPNQVQEKMKHPRKCKRSLDFDYYQEFHHMAEQPSSFGGYDFLGKIVTSKRNTLRRSRSRFEPFKDLVGDNNELQQCAQDIISVTRNQERGKKHLVYCYQRRKKRNSISTTIFIPMLQVYQRNLREINQCLQCRKKNGPDFPRMLKKRRGKRKKSTTIWKIGNLEINCQCKELVVRDGNVNVHLKRKVVPKVELDEETLRTWKVLMENDGADQETDKDKEEWWERQRKVFRGRANSFIAKMHVFQGNRRFSPWKGSVVDSVVGAFLTQNVSDHLSSSAFMSLVARFPVKSKDKETEKDTRTSTAEPTTKPKEQGEKNEHPNHSESQIVVDKKSTPEEPRIVDSKVPIEQRVDVVNNSQIPLDTGKKKKKKQQETKTDWERLRRGYCKTAGKGTNGNNMDAVDWDAVRRAPVEEVAETIVERGMNNKLARRIKAFLERIVIEHGTTDLEWLRDVPPDKAKEFLLSIRGIGLKSVECLRLLTLHHQAFPVDTNVGRVVTRLGWVPLQPLPEKVQIHLLNSYPMVNTIQKYLFPRLCTLDQKTLYELHYQLITFGKVFCTKRTPNCNACPMRLECKHYASAVASAGLTLPGLQESGVTSIVPTANEQNHGTPTSSVDLQLNNYTSSYEARNNEPIIEVPPSPEPDKEKNIPDIEDFVLESDDEIPTIRLSTQSPPSKALVTIATKPASIPRMKFVAKLRTIHLVYELPDSHPILAEFDKREHDDPFPYLLAIWLPGETEYTENTACCSSSNEETVKGTILIPCRTANRGNFPLNGTYFQVNEVFADDETSRIPMDVPRCQLWNLPRRHLGCGTSATSIFKALSTIDIQCCFLKGSICVRGFNKKTRQPRPLNRRFHISTAKVADDGKRIWKKKVVKNYFDKHILGPMNKW